MSILLLIVNTVPRNFTPNWNQSWIKHISWIEFIVIIPFFPIWINFIYIFILGDCETFWIVFFKCVHLDF